MNSSAFGNGPGVPSRAIATVSTRELTRELEELITALDHRLPRVEQAGEAAIARDAAALRAKAVKRLSELVNNPAVGTEPDSSDPS